jgi:hypothetical protein
MQTRLISMIASFYLEGNHLSMRSAKGWWPNCVKVIPVWFSKGRAAAVVLGSYSQKDEGSQHRYEDRMHDHSACSKPSSGDDTGTGAQARDTSYERNRGRHSILSTNDNNRQGETQLMPMLNLDVEG